MNTISESLTAGKAMGPQSLAMITNTHGSISSNKPL